MKKGRRQEENKPFIVRENRARENDFILQNQGLCTRYIVYIEKELEKHQIINTILLKTQNQMESSFCNQWQDNKIIIIIIIIKYYYY